MADEKKVLLSVEIVDNFIKAKKNVDEWKDALKKAENATDKNSDKISEATRELIKANNQYRNAKRAIESAAKSEELFQSITDKTNKSLGDMQRELSALRNTPFDGLEPEQIKEINQQIANLQSSINDYKLEIKGLDTSQIWKNTAEGVQFVAASASALTSTFSILGIETGTAFDKLKGKTTELIAIVQALDVVTAYLTKNKLALLAANVKNIAAMTAEKVVTAATAATYAILGKNVTATSTTFKVLRTAIISTGIGALVVAVGLLVANFEKLTGWINSSAKATKAAEEANKRYERTLLRVEEAIERVNRRITNQTNKIQNETREAVLALRERGATEEEINNVRYQSELNLLTFQIKAAKDREKQYRDQLKSQEKVIAAEKRTLNTLKEGTDKYNEQFNKINALIASKNKLVQSIKGEIQEQQNLGIALAEISLDYENSLSKKGQQIALSSLENQKKIQDEQNKQYEAGLKNDFLALQKWETEKFNQEQEYEKKRLDLLLKFQRITAEERQQSLNMLSEQEKTFQNTQLKNLNEYHDAQRKELLRLIDEDTDIQIAEITKKYKDAINAIETQEPVRLAGQSEEDYLNSPEYKNYQDFLLKKYMYEVALEKELQAEIERINENSLSNRIKKIEDEVNRQYAGDLAKFADNEAEKTRIELEAFQKTQEEKKAELDKFLAEGKISQEKYNAEIYAMDAELRSLLSKQALNNYNIELIQSNLTAKQKFEARKEYLEKEMEIYEGNTQKQLELQAELADAEQDYMDERIRKLAEWSEVVMELITSISEINMNNQQRELQEYEESKEKEKQALKKQYDSGVISKKQYDAQIEKLDQELDKKRAELEIKQAKRQKALAIFDATLKAAQAILNALNTQPFVPLGLASAVTAGILTAAQIASIASQPLPKASKGMLIQGASHASGGVAIEAEGGEAIINKHSTAMFAPLLSAINQAGGGVPFIPNISDGGYAQRTIINNNSIDENKLAKSIIKGMKDVKIYTSIEEVREADSNFSTITEKDID